MFRHGSHGHQNPLLLRVVRVVRPGLPGVFYSPGTSMTLNEHQRRYLRAIANGESLHSKTFTHGATGINPSIVVLYLEKMTEAGLLYKAGDLYCISQLGRDTIKALDNPVVPGRTVCNAASQGAYRPTWAPLRPGAEDHLQYRSLTSFRG